MKTNKEILNELKRRIKEVYKCRDYCFSDESISKNQGQEQELLTTLEFVVDDKEKYNEIIDELRDDLGIEGGIRNEKRY